MRLLPPSIFFILFLIGCPLAVSGQNKGSLVGMVYAREGANNTSSLNYSIENRCKGDPCVRIPLSQVEILFDDKYFNLLRLQPEWQLPNMRDPFNEEFRARWEKNPNEFFWVQPGLEHLYQPKVLDFVVPGSNQWSCTKENVKGAAKVTCRDKDTATPEYDFYGRIGFKLKYKSLLNERLRLTAEYKSDTFFDEKFKPRPAARLELKDTTDDCLRPPFVVHPGQYFYSGLNPDRLKDSWLRNYGDSRIPGPSGYFRTPMAYGAFVVKHDTKQIVWLPVPQLMLFDPVLMFIRTMLPASVSPKDFIWLFGMNAFGEVFMYSRLNDLTIHSSGSRCNGGITETTKYVFQGKRLCVCGCYTEDDDLDLSENLTVFTLDGKPITPDSLSQNTATFTIPDGTSPGKHTIGYTSPYDGEIIDALDFRVLQLTGKIDQSALLRGESTKMKLSIFGTEDSLPLQVTNKTPAIISITGGAEQTIKTTGGADNSVERDVKGIKVGNFNIEYKVDEAPCPCFSRQYEVR